ncbi:hypothetical protein L9G16_04070 [Shewanella sp. A25]|nr:hypothetical protein [Shewanella shenzhenensis]
MTKLTFRAELNAHIPSERRALVECAGWLQLKKEGRLDELKAKQKETVLAGLFLQIAAPQLVHKLAANLDEASIESLQRFLGLSESSKANVDIEQLLSQQFASFDERLKAAVTEAAAVKAKHSAIAEFLQKNTQVSASTPASQAELASELSETKSDTGVANTTPSQEESEADVQRKVAAMKNVRKRNLF